jgi:peptidoglycan/xylan/chitin deacetylase (PgdA/CDA1 family)
MTAIMLHHFHGGDHQPSQGSLSESQFKQLLIAEPDADLVFDDGLKCQYDIAFPVLKEMDRKGIFCVCTGHFEDKPATVEIFRWMRHKIGLEDFYKQFHEIMKPSFDDPSAFPDFYTENDRVFQLTRDAIGPTAYNMIMSDMFRSLQGYHGYSEIANKVYMSQDDMRDIAQSHCELGLHTHTHPLNLSELPAAEQRAEWQSNIDWVKSLTSKMISSASYPSNSFNGVTKIILGSIGIPFAYRADEQHNGNRELPRVDHRALCIKHGICE